MSLKRRSLNDAEEEDPSSSLRPRTKVKLDPATITVSQPKSHALDYPSTLNPTPKPTPFQKPTHLLSFSYTPEHVLEFTNSALRYFVDPPQAAKLGYGYDRWVRKDDGRGRIDALLSAVLRAQSGPASLAQAVQDIGVVAWRGVMTRILTAPYEERDGWELNVMFVNGTMYFEEHLSNARLKEKNEMEPRHRIQTYYGYSFESYCTSATSARQENNLIPGEPAGWGGDVDTNVQWCSVVRTKLGGTRMVIGGEVDCVRGKYTGTTDEFVELKTSLAIRGPHDETKFEKKLLKFYFQSFLLGVPEIFVGFRTPSGQLTTTQSFKTIQIPRLVRGKPGAWDPLLCLEWGHQFLLSLRRIVQAGVNDDSLSASVWRVKFTPQSGVRIELLDPAGVEDVENGEERVGFLPKWYWKELETGTPTPSDMGIPVTENSRRPSLAAGWQI